MPHQNYSYVPWNATVLLPDGLEQRTLAFDQWATDVNLRLAQGEHLVGVFPLAEPGKAIALFVGPMIDD